MRKTGNGTRGQVENVAGAERGGKPAAAKGVDTHTPHVRTKNQVRGERIRREGAESVSTPADSMNHTHTHILPLDPASLRWKNLCQPSSMCQLRPRCRRHNSLTLFFPADQSLPRPSYSGSACASLLHLTRSLLYLTTCRQLQSRLSLSIARSGKRQPCNSGFSFFPLLLLSSSSFLLLP